MRHHIPNLLTLGRLILVVPLCAAFWLPLAVAGWAALGLFLLAAITDWFDGRLARRWNVESDIGRWLDPLADKVLVTAALLMMLGSGQLGTASAVAVIVIVVREIMISGLREFLGQKQVVLHVTGIAKAKTAVQLGATAFLLFAMTGIGQPLLPLAVATLWLAALLTAWSGWDYMRKGLQQMR